MVKEKQDCRVTEDNMNGNIATVVTCGEDDNGYRRHRGKLPGTVLSPKVAGCLEWDCGYSL